MQSNTLSYLILAAVAAISAVIALRAIKHGKTGPQFGLKWTHADNDERDS